MLLGEALSARKDALSRIGSLQGEISSAAVTYADDEDEGKADAKALLGQLETAVSEFERLSVAINDTNNTAIITFDGRSLTIMEAVVLRENLKLRARAYQSIVSSIDSAKRPYGYRRTTEDVKVKVLLDLPTLRSESDSISEKMRRLDLVLQQKNWTTELVEG